MRIFILSLVLGLFSLEAMALGCDITNYKDYIGSSELLTNELIKETEVGCNLTKADLREAYLWGADLRGAVLWGADLRGAVLWGADLRGANLQGANLQGVKLQWANLHGANFENAIYNDKTDFPGLDSSFIKKHNMIKKQ